MARAHTAQPSHDPMFKIITCSTPFRLASVATAPQRAFPPTNPTPQRAQHHHQRIQLEACRNSDGSSIISILSVIYPGYHVVSKGLVPGPCESGHTWAHVHRSFVYPQPTSLRPFYPHPPHECMSIFRCITAGKHGTSRRYEMIDSGTPSPENELL